MLPPSAIPSTSAILTPIFACRCATDSLADFVRLQPGIGMGIGTEAMLPESRELWRSCATVADLHEDGANRRGLNGRHHADLALVQAPGPRRASWGVTL